MNISTTTLHLKKYARRQVRMIGAYIRSHKRRVIAIGGVGLIVMSGLITAYIISNNNYSYSLGTAGDLLTPISPEMTKRLSYDGLKHEFTMDGKTVALSGEVTQMNSQNASAVANSDAAKGISVSDPVNKLDFSLTPKFNLATGKQDGNRIVYPLKDRSGWAVYTMQASGVKEDLLLTQSTVASQTFTYTLGLGSSYEARVESDGSIGIYGSTLLSGNVTTGSESDAALLLKARAQAKKTTHLFTIPRPVIVQHDKQPSRAAAVYSLNGDTLSVHVTGLLGASYPLSIDPSIYVVTAQQFMQGNNETNINFDVANKLIKKSPTTGARFNSWNTTTSAPSPSWAGGTVVAGGYLYSIGGTALTGQVFSNVGSNTLTIPAGVTAISLKVWGGGGGSGAGGSGTATGGAGGAGGYIAETIAVTPGEVLNVYVGGGGSGGATNTAGGGGGGGGYSSIYRGSTMLGLAGGGGGGGGGRSTGATAGGAGGAGGGTTAVAGTASGAALGGGAGTPTTFGTGGTGGLNVGAAGAALTGGLGGDGRTATGADGSGALGGLATGGAGGLVVSTTTAGGAGGGAGLFGGGGGSGSTTTTGGGGGGGGSSFTQVGATGVTNTAGSGVTPANSTDTYRNGAGTGAAAGAAIAAGKTGSDGLIYVVFGAGGAAATSTVSWSQLNTSTGSIDSPNPGNGTCTGWCTNSAYNLPAARTNFSTVYYNGFIYVMGGLDSSGTRQSTVYVAKVGANGEPQLWHPTDTNKANWVYWYTATGLSSVRSDFSAVAYNNRMYIVGGRSTSGPVNSVEIADIVPTGTLGSWSSSTVIPTNLFGHSVQVYNDRLYIIGGDVTVGGAPTNLVYYNKINSTGTLNSWNSTSSFLTGRLTGGGNMTVVWGAYIYISGGCSAVNGSGYCTTVASDTQVASINADGSIDTWNTVGGVTSQRMGYGLIAWRNNIYAIAGCSAQNTTTGDCISNLLNTSIYGSVNQDGDASTVAQSVASGTAPCSGASPYSCNLPSASVGDVLNATAILNGYLYIMGGCNINNCSTASAGVIYTSVGSDGSLTKPAACTGGTYTDSYCVSPTSLPQTLAAAGTTIFNNRMYVVGGWPQSGGNSFIYYTTIANDGSLSAWSSANMATIGATAVSYDFAYARANPASAGTNPGNLYIFGGCTTPTSVSCTTMTQNVYKCTLSTTGVPAACTTTGQLAIGTLTGATGTGLGAMAGTVYANYIYLIGGLAPGISDLKTVLYAQFDNSNNVVAASGTTWVTSPNLTFYGRRRGAAFGYNGYIYVVGGYDGTTGGAGVLADIEFAKLSVSDGSVGAFSVSAVNINQRWGLSVPVSNSFAYVIGGCTVGTAPTGCTTRTDTVQTFQVYNNDSGAPAGYSTSANTYGTSPSRIGASSTILNGYIYVAGGCTSTTDCTTAITDVSYAAIDVNGAIGTWSSTTAALPAVRTWGRLEPAGGSLYYIGGQSSTSTDYRTEVYYATPSSGNVTSWSTATNGLPNARSQFGSAVWNDRLYIVGGLGAGTGCTGGVCNTVYVSPQLSTGGNITSAWSTASTSFNIARSGLATMAYSNNLYVIGGNDGTNYLNDTQFAKISTSTGLVGSWNYSESLPSPLSQAEAFAANGYIYLIGGRSAATTCNPSTLVAPISANTTIATGNNPTGIGGWYVTNQRYTGARYGAGAVFNDGKAYVLGGGCGTTLTYASPVIQQTTLLSQPQVAKYSIMIDTDSDVFPTNWLLNGIDNSIGANWQLKYRSMTNTTTSCKTPAMTTWGSEFNFGNVTLGQYKPYVPYDGSGVTTNCARFYYFNVTVDSSYAFGYPDDVTRGPTITDLTLQFTADPAKRLVHGRTFTGGIQQPLDTPYYTN